MPQALDKLTAARASLEDVEAHSRDLLEVDAFNKGVEVKLPKYDEVLELGLKPSGEDKRKQVNGIAWGKIEADAVILGGLADATENISTVVKKGRGELLQDWKGEAADNFSAAVQQVERTLDDFTVAARATADGIATTMANIRNLYTTYRDESLPILEFKELPTHEDWIRPDEGKLEELADMCGCGLGNCEKDDVDGQAIKDQLLVKHEFDEYARWDCGGWDDVTRRICDLLVKSGKDNRRFVSETINTWYQLTDTLIGNVKESYEEALHNLQVLAESRVFANLRMPGGAVSPGGDPGAGGGDPGGGAPGGGGPPGGGSPEAMMPPPLPNPAPEPEPVQAAAPEPTDQAAAEQAESVQIKDGDRTISVTSPDGEGHVKVTVAGADGKAKAYDLDFDAASGLESRPAAGPGDGASAGPQPAGAAHVPAGTNGKCVIQDGPLTITAERPLFDPGTIKIEVDDGVNEPTTYTLDFDEADSSSPDAQAAAKPGDVDAEKPDTAAAEPAGDAPAAPEAAAQKRAEDAPGSGDSSAGDEPAGQDEPAKEPAAKEPVDGKVDGGDGQAEQLTTTQAWTGDPSGAAAASLVPDQANGEAELSSAADGEPAGAAGGAMPLMAGAGSGGAAEGGRAGTGWSVHGDLFDNGDPVYSMHGVLGQDDLQGK